MTMFLFPAISSSRLLKQGLMVPFEIKVFTSIYFKTYLGFEHEIFKMFINVLEVNLSEILFKYVSNDIFIIKQ